MIEKTDTQRLIEYLDCPCEAFASMADDDPILEALSKASVEGKRVGYVPVLVKADETLLECLMMNVEEAGGDCSAQAVRDYRNKQMESPLPDGGEVLQHRLREYQDEELDWEKEAIGDINGGEPNDRLASYWNYETERTNELVLAKIPVAHPWEIFAWLPMGGWNDCPDTRELMAVSKYWYETMGAVPVALTHDELEFAVQEPVSGTERARTLAVEQYAFCPDRVDQCEESGRIGSLAHSLTMSNIWYFWWD